MLNDLPSSRQRLANATSVCVMWVYDPLAALELETFAGIADGPKRTEDATRVQGSA